METNSLIFDFIVNNYLIIIIASFFILGSTFKVIPPEWAGFWKYNNNREADGPSVKLSVLRFILHGLIDSVLSAFLIPIVAMFEFTKMITIIIFSVVIFDFFVRHEISAEGVTLIIIGIIALYLDRLIETGKTLKLFGGTLQWEKKDQ